jgi:hypothetical protein
MQTLFGNPPQAPPPAEAAPAVYRIEIDRKLASTALAVVTLLNPPDGHRPRASAHDSRPVCVS